jgi:hypothetical protein
MATSNKSVPQLDAVTTLADADLHHVVVSNVDKKITTEDLRTAILGTNTYLTVYTLTATILSADVLTSNATPIVLIAAQGAGKAIVPLVAMMTVDYATTPYATNTTPNIYVDTANKGCFESTSGLAKSVVSTYAMGGVAANGATDTQYIANKALYFKTNTGNPTAGDSDLILNIQYIIVDL